MREDTEQAVAKLAALQLRLNAQRAGLSPDASLQEAIDATCPKSESGTPIIDVEDDIWLLDYLPEEMRREVQSMPHGPLKDEFDLGRRGRRFREGAKRARPAHKFR